MSNPHDQNRARRKYIVVGLMMAMFLAAIEATIVATAMPTVIGDLGGMKLYGLVGSSYLLASTVTIPLYGRLADIRGRKTMIMFGIAMFLLGSGICAVSHTLGLLVIGRIIQGLGAGAIQPITVTLVGDLFALEERGRIQGLMGAVWGLAGVAGPILGGLLVSTLGWRSIFWLNLPFGVIAAVILAYTLHEGERSSTAPPIDWLGAMLLIGGSGALLAATGHWPVQLTAIGVILLGLLFVIERRIEHPLLPIGLLTRRDVAVGSVSALLMGVCFMGTVNYLPLYLQEGLGKSPSIAGSSLTPLLIGWPIAATLSSTFLVRTGFRIPLRVGSITVAAAMAGLVFWTAHPSMWVLWPVMITLGAGLGLSTTSVMIAVQTSVAYNQRGLATAFNMFSRSMGGAMGVGLAGLLVGVSVATHGGGTEHVDDPAALGAALTKVFIGLAVMALVHIPLCFFYPGRTNAKEDAAELPPVHAPVME